VLGAIIGAAVAVFLVVGFLYLSVRVVREYQRIVSDAASAPRARGSSC